MNRQFKVEVSVDDQIIDQASETFNIKQKVDFLHFSRTKEQQRSFESEITISNY